MAIASGAQVQLWNWTKDASSRTKLKFRPSKHKFKYFKVIVHTRNIRAVLFHPSGDHLLIVAPDPPRLPGGSIIPSRYDD